MPLFGPPNVAQLEAKRDVQGLIKALQYRDSAVRIAAAEALAPIKDGLAVEPLVATLADEDPGVRRACIRALAARGGLRVVEPLVGALNDPDPDVRAAASQAVYRHLMADPDQDARRATATALGKSGTADAVAPLVKAIMDADEGVRVASIKSLQALNNVDAVVPLITVLAHEQVRQKAGARSSLAAERAATQALDAICDIRAIKPLQAALHHDDQDVREIAVRRLAKIGSPMVVDTLAGALTDRDPVIRRAAARGLQEVGWQPPAGDAGARYWAALREWEKCAECGPGAIPFLIGAFATVDTLERADIISALVKVGWEPKEPDAIAGHFWAWQGRWDKCIEIGEASAEGLESVTRNAPQWRDRVAAAATLESIGQARPEPFARLDLVRHGLEIMDDGEASADDKRNSFEAFLSEGHQYDSLGGERVEFCKCGYPAARVRKDGLREPLTDMLGFERSASNAMTYYCPNCGTRRATVAS
jgi:HEAT repeat protein